jgi:hypothetical protein
MSAPEINLFLNSFMPVSLEEMDGIKLMDRFDSKYVFPVTMLPGLLDRLSSSYKILEIGNRRSFLYNTRYMDTSDMIFFTQHVTGKLARYKIRFRKYESTGLTFLEVKKKTNKNRTIKWRIERDFNSGVIDEPASAFIKKHIPFNSFILQYNLENKFTRVTLADLDSKERITIDTCMSYSTVEGGSTELPYLAIVELKSNGYPSISSFIRAIRQMGIQPTTFSKYCIGNAMLRDIPKKNILKQKLLLLNKIENEYSKSNFS